MERSAVVSIHDCERYDVLPLAVEAVRDLVGKSYCVPDCGGVCMYTQHRASSSRATPAGNSLSAKPRQHRSGLSGFQQTCN